MRGVVTVSMAGVLSVANRSEPLGSAWLWAGPGLFLGDAGAEPGRDGGTSLSEGAPALRGACTSRGNRCNQEGARLSTRPLRRDYLARGASGCGFFVLFVCVNIHKYVHTHTY